MTSKLYDGKNDENPRTSHGSIRRLGFKAFVRSPNTGFAVQQVKEKFGTLRFYCVGTEAIHRYIQLAERLSAITCEECGKPGTPNHSGWIRTLCEDCRTNKKR